MWGGRQLTSCVNVAVLWALVPLAYGAPPDPTYVAGLWDNAADDVVVTLATSSTCLTDTHSANDLLRFLVVFAPVPPGEQRLLPAATLSFHPSRAPPPS